MSRDLTRQGSFFQKGEGSGPSILTDVSRDLCVPGDGSKRTRHVTPSPDVQSGPPYPLPSPWRHCPYYGDRTTHPFLSRLGPELPGGHLTQTLRVGHTEPVEQITIVYTRHGVVDTEVGHHRPQTLFSVPTGFPRPFEVGPLDNTNVTTRRLSD